MELYEQVCFGDIKFTQGQILKQFIKHSADVQGEACAAMSLDWLMTCMDDCPAAADKSPVYIWSQKCERGYPFFLALINNFRVYGDIPENCDDFSRIAEAFVMAKGHHLVETGSEQLNMPELAAKTIIGGTEQNKAYFIGIRSRRENHATAFYTFAGSGYLYDPNFGVLKLNNNIHGGYGIDFFMKEYWKLYSVNNIQFVEII